MLEVEVLEVTELEVTEFGHNAYFEELKNRAVQEGMKEN